MRSVINPLYRIYLSWLPYLKFRPDKWIYEIVRFTNDYRLYKSQQKNQNFETSVSYWYPCLTDRTSNTPLDPVYFFQDSWAASKIFEYKPASHVDIGSAAKTIGILSQFVPITMVDIRPIALQMKGLHFKQGTILDLPFETASQDSVSSLCVIEHIGLGRYGDPIDPWGSEKAIAELQRITRTDGIILFSVPIDSTCRVYFNAHRAFTKEYILNLFSSCELMEDKYIYGTELVDTYNQSKGFGIGLYKFRKK
ncbi:MAG: class I SAM-dependent methyltransferase [Cytophaga sp.]|uniref:class I SAM-dependent methyltransferase n=1 Tax=Cytophaga sp. TaxID=29535 RepID=UPI003F7F99E8